MEVGFNGVCTLGRASASEHVQSACGVLIQSPISSGNKKKIIVSKRYSSWPNIRSWGTPVSISLIYIFRIRKKSPPPKIGQISNKIVNRTMEVSVTRHSVSLQPARAHFSFKAECESVVSVCRLTKTPFVKLFLKNPWWLTFFVKTTFGVKVTQNG